MIRVRLKDLIEGMEFQSDEMTAYLHRPSGRVLTVSDDAVSAAENDDDEWVTAEEFAEARQMLEHEGDYLALPDRFEIDEYRMMERFALGIPYARQRDEVLAALRGSGAFRRFKEAVLRLQLTEEWYTFRERRYEEVARAWCESNNIEIDAHADA